MRIIRRILEDACRRSFTQQEGRRRCLQQEKVDACSRKEGGDARGPQGPEDNGCARKSRNTNKLEKSYVERAN